jgi:O-antigen/teichoic acid export membrane protein
MLAYGPGYEKGAPVLRILVFTAVLMALNSVVGQAIVSKGKIWAGFSFNALWAAVLLIASAFFVQRNLGALGLALAALVAYACHAAWQFFYLTRLVPRDDKRRASAVVLRVDPELEQ